MQLPNIQVPEHFEKDILILLTGSDEPLSQEFQDFFEKNTDLKTALEKAIRDDKTFGDLMKVAFTEPAVS